jgi:hypothetical protein
VDALSITPEACIIKANNDRIPTKPSNGEFFTLEELKEIVGGWVEVVRLQDDRVMIVNEEGLNDRLPYNAGASELYPFNPIVGDVLVCESRYIQ